MSVQVQGLRRSEASEACQKAVQDMWDCGGRVARSLIS